MSAPEEATKQVDESLYSRQLYVYGHEAQRRMQNASVLVIGMRGLGIEIAKNVVLAGVHAVSILDNTITAAADLGSNFYLKESDIGKVTRADASFQQLSTLNPYVDINVVKADITEELISKYSVVVVTGETFAKQIEINNWCRKSNTSFISADIQGLLLSIFVDNGPTHTISDPDGNQCLRGLIAHIENSNPIIVTVSGERHQLSDGDSVSFEDVEGMTQLNDQAPAKIKSITRSSFSVDIDGTNMPPFTGTRGYFNQVKIPFNIEMESLESALKSRPFCNDWLCEMIYPHCLALALSDFRTKNGGAYPISTNKAQIMEVYEQFGTYLKEQGDVNVADLSPKQKAHYFNLIRAASTSLSPMAAVGGGHVGQEVLKAVSGKFTPIQQFYYYKAPEAFPTCITDETEDIATGFTPNGSRYDDYIITFGTELQKKVQDQKLFLIGAGAIGCEMLKNWAMMGVATNDTGSITVTDMDSIERSNLNRQFLFRSSDVGKLKSVAAGDAAKVMNPSLKIHAQSLKVAKDTENIYNDEFWQDLTGVYTALDNVDARLYVDARCVYYGKPLVDSGTLGTAGNTQVVVPYVTESYGSTRDPPESGIPLCTLKIFPHKIEHTIQWARDVFEGDFKQGPEEVNNYIKNANYINTLKEDVNTVVGRVNVLKKRLVTDKPINFDDCLKWARSRFDHEYNHNIRQLLHQLPLDAVTTEGTPLWSGTKRPPTPIQFNVDDQLHFDYILAAAMLYAFNYNITGYTDVERIKDVLATYEEIPWAPTETKIATNDEEMKAMQEAQNNLMVDTNTEVDAIAKDLPTQAELAGVVLQPVEFEKDDDSNHHIAYITACSNLRARNYQIKEESAHMTKFIAGKIIPAIATTTALVTGLVCLEMYKLLDDKKFEDYRSSYVTLATNIFAASEPSPPQVTEVEFPSGLEWKWSLWDKLVIDLGHEPTLLEVIDYLQGEKYGATVTAVTIGPALVWMDFAPSPERAANEQKPLSKLALDMWEASKTSDDQDAPHIGQWVQLEVTLENDDGDDLAVPECKIRVGGW